MRENAECVEANDMHHKVLADRVRYFKETEGGKESVCKAMEAMCNKAAKIASMEIALAMLEDGKIPLELIAKYSKLSMEEIKALAAT